MTCFGAILRGAVMAGAVCLSGPSWAAGSGSGLLAEARTVLPAEGIHATVMLFSDGPWGAADVARMRALRARGAAVIGVDSRALLSRIEAVDDDCVYVMADVEALAKSLQRGVGTGAYRQPLLAGTGTGGALALALLAQTPPGTVEGAVVADPAAGIPLRRPLCTDADHRTEGGVEVYELSDTPLPAPVDILMTPDAPPEGRAHAAALQSAHPDIAIAPAAAAADAALTAALVQRVAEVEAEPLGRPLTLLQGPPRHDTLAVIYSGDGGWRDIDKQIGGALAAAGVPVVGVDSLRYFWQERSPEETAADLARIIAAYTAQWKVPNVLLLGYSFGADVLAATYDRLPPEARAKVRQISLLGLSDHAAWEISVSGWLGQESDGPETGPDIARIDPALLQCFYGAEEEATSPCPALAARGAEVFRTAGGHHFDGNYQALAQDVLTGLDRRLGR